MTTGTPVAGHATSRRARGDAAQSGTAEAHGCISTKDAHRKRMARIDEGQVRGIARMIHEDKYCIHVLTSAVTMALQAVSLALLEAHMTHCVANRRHLT